MTTMMRWVALFLAQGLATRGPDPTHAARAVLFTLSAEGAERVRTQLETELG
jgi:hypothetical protein